MVDLHAHVLPGIDDGPPDLDASVALLRAVEADGIGTIAATPHVRDDHPDVVPSELAGRVAELQARLDAEAVGVRVVPSGEVDLAWAMGADDDALKLVSIGQRGTDLLVETPYGEPPPTLDDLLFSLAVKGYRVLLAHPERGPAFQRHPERLRALHERGVLMQVTAFALVSPNRPSRSHKLATQLVRDGLATVLASDAHAVGGGRPAGLTGGVTVASRLVGPERARWLVRDAPAAILEGRPLPPAPEIVASRGSRLAFWRR
jgi:protein-tyrosine phosphatase